MKKDFQKLNKQDLSEFLTKALQKKFCNGKILDIQLTLSEEYVDIEGGYDEGYTINTFYIEYKVKVNGPWLKLYL